MNHLPLRGGPVVAGFCSKTDFKLDTDDDTGYYSIFVAGGVGITSIEAPPYGLEAIVDLLTGMREGSIFFSNIALRLATLLPVPRVDQRFKMRY